VPVALIVFPSLPQMNAPDPLPEPQSVLAGVAAEHGFILVDLLRRYAAIGEPALLESDKAHPSQLGHRVAAEELSRALAAAGALPR
jgi:lysophospholipase L1-like esterase